MLRRGSRPLAAVTPAAVHPQPQVGVPAHVHLEHVGAPLRELAHGVGAVGRRRLDRVLVDRSGTARSGSGSANTGITGAPVRSASAASDDVVAAGPLEEVDLARVRLVHVLIDQDRHALVRLRAVRSTRRSGPAPVDDRVAGARRASASSSAFSRGLSSGRASTPIGSSRSACTIPCSSQKPKWPVKKQHAAPLRIGLARTLVALELDRARASASGGSVLNLQQLEQQAAEVREHAARDRAPFAGRPRSESAAARLFSAMRRCGRSRS